MSRLQQEGIFKAMPKAWTVKESDNSQSVAIVIDFRVTAALDGDSWTDWTQYEEQTITGWFYIVKKDGTINTPTVKSLIESGVWSGMLADIDGQPTATVCQIDCQNDEYNGKVTLKVRWINPEDYAPGLKAASPATIKQLDGRYGSLLRAVASSTPKPTPAPKPAPPQPSVPEEPDWLTGPEQ